MNLAKYNFAYLFWMFAALVKQDETIVIPMYQRQISTSNWEYIEF